MDDRNQIVKYISNQFFKGNIDEMAKITGYPKAKINHWIKGTITPNHTTIEYIIRCKFTPEFTVVKEFFTLDPAEPIKTQLKRMYKGHEHRSGIYAFYDAMANLLYVGKATKLLSETYAALTNGYEIHFPAGIKNKNVLRSHVTRYVSAYDIKSFDAFDYPRHVESLILRISKPRMNKKIGILEKAFPKLAD